MEVTSHVSVDQQYPRQWSTEKVATFVRSLGPAECFQSAGDQVGLEWMTVFSLQRIGVDDSVFFALSLNEGDEVGMSLGGEGMCTDGVAVMEELRKHYLSWGKSHDMVKD